MPEKKVQDHTIIQPFVEVERQLYGYTLPQVQSHIGFVKIGDTTQEVNRRIMQQVGTAGLNPELLFTRLAKRSDGTWFRDYDFHRYLRLNKIDAKNFNDSASEWFDFGDNIEQAEVLADKFIQLDYDVIQLPDGDTEYILRNEQQEAVNQTLMYIRDGNKPREFLWNAKPRFGKTLSTYDLIRKLQPTNVLIVTNRPAIANSWYHDFVKFIATKEPQMKFVSNADTLKDKGLSRQEFLDFIISNENAQQVVFLSLQDLKGGISFGGMYNKLQWVAQLNWDLLVIDEAHEGIDTAKTDKAFDQINREFTLHLSGTPFKAIANNKFDEQQIYNWSYIDEQQAKQEWSIADGHNPYETLPKMNLFTYQMSDMVRAKLEVGMTINDETNVDYAFDLNEFFKTKENGTFEYEDDVVRFLDNLSSGKFPFSSDQYLAELNHTFWLLPWVASAKALEKLLNNHPVFKDYHIILAAGDGVSLVDEEDEVESEALNYTENTKSFDRVVNAIERYDKTITLSVGQLTTGVTVPQWSAVLMLNNIKSPALYFQAAFRAQNPYQYTDNEGNLIRKENAYIFDFSPTRTLQLYSEFATNLSGERTSTTLEQRDRIRVLLNFFPVIAEDDEGYMQEINAEQVMTIPNKMVAREVVRQGFMSNLLFKNISGIFAPNSRMKEILDKIEPEKDKKLAIRRSINVTDPQIDDEGNVLVPEEQTSKEVDELFGDKIYGDASSITDILNQSEKTPSYQEKEIVQNIVSQIDLSGFYEHFEINKKNQQDTIQKNFEETISRRIESSNLTYANKVRDIDEEYSQKLQDIEKKSDKTEEEVSKEKEVIQTHRQQEIQKAQESFVDIIVDEIEKTVAQEVRIQQVKKEEDKKKITEDDTRDHLRGFSRTIPSFLMAYGDEDTTLATFDQNIDPETFEELTSITIEEFKVLRDGYYDEYSNQQIAGVFNDIVFDESVKEFMDTKEALKDYFDEEQEEDIFDYIPPQKTNQIFTPKLVVKKMVDVLEEENPGIFSDKNVKFADLYAKSGLYMTEIIKKLNKGLEAEIPEQQERLEWIFSNQIYMAAPTNILYNIIRNFVYNDEWESFVEGHLIQSDTAKIAQEGRLADEIEAYFEKDGEQVKFDVIIGNPPYQGETLGSNTTYAPPLYNDFLDESYELSSKVMMIHPARFLFNAGSTPAQWNQKMLNDTHLKIIDYTENSNQVFINTDIKGGVAITYRDVDKKYEKIGTFTTNEELNSILKKVENSNFKGIHNIISGRGVYKLSDKALEDYPQIENIQSKGHKYDVGSSAFKILKNLIFFEELPDDAPDYVRILGLFEGKRVYYWVHESYLNAPESFRMFKVIIPQANGNGSFGEKISSPLVLPPYVGATETFLSIGGFDSEFEAESALKYIKGKFARALLSVLKITQANTRTKWSKVPLQDFTEKSDIDWTQSVSDIDQQLYKKYGLTEEEINFIETKVQPME